MNSDLRTSGPEGGSIFRKSAIVTVLLALGSAPILLPFLNAFSGPIGFLLIIVPMVILQIPLIRILIHFKALPKVSFGRPSDSTESSSVHASDSTLHV